MGTVLTFTMVMNLTGLMHTTLGLIHHFNIIYIMLFRLETNHIALDSSSNVGIKCSEVCMKANASVLNVIEKRVIEHLKSSMKSLNQITAFY